MAFYFFTWFSFYELGGRYTLIFSSEVTSSGDAGDRYTLIFKSEVTSFGDVLFGRFSINLKQWSGGIPCL